jgi:hypothetical protein
MNQIKTIENMKNFLSIFVIVIIGIMAFASCAPIEDRMQMTGSVTEAEARAKIKVEVIPFESKINQGTMVKSNYLKFSSEGLAPALTSFVHGLGTIVGTFADSVQSFVLVGEYTIYVNVLNADGTVPSWSPLEYPVTVEETFNVDPAWALLCGEGEKAWTWNGGESGEDKIWGNGGYRSDRQPSWWGRTLADIGTESNAVGEGDGAYMIFSAKGATLTKIRNNNTQQAGTFRFDMDRGKTVAGTSPLWVADFEKELNEDQPAGAEWIKIDPSLVWSKGKLFTSNTTVLVGKMQNRGEGPVNDYDILKLTEEELVLAWPEDGDVKTGDWGGCWYWMFKAK